MTKKNRIKSMKNNSSKKTKNIFSDILIIFLSKIIPTIILSIIFYFMLTPLALFGKIFNQIKIISGYKKKSFFIVRNKSFTKGSFEKTWQRYSVLLLN